MYLTVSDIITKIRAVASRYRINPEIAIAQIRAESNFKPDATSNAGALGIAQIMPDTARDYGITNPADLFKVDIALDTYGRIMSGLLTRYKGNYELALAGYNAGPGAVARAGNKVPNFPETKNYIASILSRGAKAAAQDVLVGLPFALAIGAFLISRRS